MDDALKQAKLLDDHLQRTGEVVGPLHGTNPSGTILSVSYPDLYPNRAPGIIEGPN